VIDGMLIYLESLTSGTRNLGDKMLGLAYTQEIEIEKEGKM